MVVKELKNRKNTQYGKDQSKIHSQLQHFKVKNKEAVSNMNKSFKEVKKQNQEEQNRTFHLETYIIEEKTDMQHNRTQ